MIKCIGFGCPQFLLCIYALVTHRFYCVNTVAINIKRDDWCSYSVGNG